MRTLVVLLCGCAILLLNACSSNSTGPSSSSDNSNLYLPLSKGSLWTYSSSSGMFTDEVGGDSVLLGHTYKIMIGTQNGVAQNSVYRAVGKGINITKVDTNGVLQDVVYLKDNVKVGDQWSYYSIDTGIPSFYEFQCTGLDETRTIQGKTYSHVLAVTQTLGYNFNGQRIVAGSATSYYSLGIGMIATYLSNGQSIELVSYALK